MYKAKVFNKISKKGLDSLNDTGVTISDTGDNPDVIFLRSHKLHDYQFNDNLKAIGRAGAGTNNIPIETCTEKGVVVFNTPGANANAVKELVLSGLFLASRNIYNGLTFVNNLQNTDCDISAEVEGNKSKFKGFEVSGKKLGIIGLGAIGVLVANDAIKLGIDVYGFDPYISVNRAWGLSSRVKQAESLKEMLSKVDFLTFHMPLNDSTKAFFDADKIKLLKENAIILNFARPEIIVEDDLIKALESNQVKKFVTDFPNNKILKLPNVIGLPHLGASTEEAEDNCAVMIVDQVHDFMKNGNIQNSVNFPDCRLERTSEIRLTVLHENKPNMIGQILAPFSENDINITEMVNKSKGDLAYTIIDIDKDPSEDLLSMIKNVDGIKFLRKV
tara:strand:+ start:14546 stop:15709 length:1164 start_codon:yes stop_codon:yes gene_type:complete